MFLLVVAVSGAAALICAERFSEALFAQPTFAPALEGLARAYEQLGHTRRASSLRALVR
jgi:hypothetical protein